MERRLIFRIAAYDEKEKIGEGTHERVYHTMGDFQDKANSKLG